MQIHFQDACLFWGVKNSFPRWVARGDIKEALEYIQIGFSVTALLHGPRITSGTCTETSSSIYPINTRTVGHNMDSLLTQGYYFPWKRTFHWALRFQTFTPSILEGTPPPFASLEKTLRTISIVLIQPAHWWPFVCHPSPLLSALLLQLLLSGDQDPMGKKKAWCKRALDEEKHLSTCGEGKGRQHSWLSYSIHMALQRKKKRLLWMEISI